MSDFKGLKCTKFDYWCSTPDLTAGAYSPPYPPAVFKGPTSKGREEPSISKEMEGGI